MLPFCSTYGRRPNYIHSTRNMQPKSLSGDQYSFSWLNSSIENKETQTVQDPSTLNQSAERQYDPFRFLNKRMPRSYHLHTGIVHDTDDMRQQQQPCSFDSVTLGVDQSARVERPPHTPIFGGGRRGPGTKFHETSKISSRVLPHSLMNVDRGSLHDLLAKSNGGVGGADQGVRAAGGVDPHSQSSYVSMLPHSLVGSALSVDRKHSNDKMVQRQVALTDDESAYTALRKEMFVDLLEIFSNTNSDEQRVDALTRQRKRVIPPAWHLRFLAANGKQESTLMALARTKFPSHADRVIDTYLTVPTFDRTGHGPWLLDPEMRNMPEDIGKLVEKTANDWHFHGETWSEIFEDVEALERLVGALRRAKGEPQALQTFIDVEQKNRVLNALMPRQVSDLLRSQDAANRWGFSLEERLALLDF